MVISVLFSSKVIKSIYPEVKVSEMILSGFTLAMGSTPVTELNNVDVCLRVVSHSENHYFVRGNVENMRVQLTFYYSCAGKKQSNQGTGKQGDESFFENQYRSLTNIINQIKFESDTVVDCCISIVPESELGDYDDIEGDYSQSVSLLSWLIIFAQIAEVDAYHFDHIKRNESANFWARKITATVNVQKLYHLKSKINVRLEIKKAKLLKMHDQNWRTLSVSAYDANHFVEFTGKMAHQLLKENL
ncbi:MAG: AvrD family protein [Lentilactobacillus hilgardii]|uniref:AvrD family protein n=1 Tax=Lentilactobacillus hilgardii TaxID=1588 RepID=UPI0039E9ABD7